MKVFTIHPSPTNTGHINATFPSVQDVLHKQENRYSEFHMEVGMIIWQALVKNFVDRYEITL